jgi:CRP/FNR family transcriptional regulator, anaerobic regulatory protein
VREMVSRLLKRFEREGFVSVGRERVLLLAPEALRALANDRFRPSLPSP